MKERERAVVSSLVILLAVVWLGFAVHRSPRFAGSLWGGALGVGGALLMLWPLGYSAVKRIPALKARAAKRASMSTLLAVHVYAGVIGAVLAVLHTGHKFDSTLGISLTASMLVAVLTGFIGRYFMRLVSQELREKQDLLARLRDSYEQTAGELAARPDPVAAYALSRGVAARVFGPFFAPEAEAGPGGGLTLSSRAVRLAESMADLEYAVKAHELLKRRFAMWLRLHIAASVIFYALLALHVLAGVYFGLRWFG